MSLHQNLKILYKIHIYGSQICEGHTIRCRLYDKKFIAMLLCEFIVIIKTREKKEFKANSLYNGICAINQFYQEMFKTREHSDMSNKTDVLLRRIFSKI